MYLLWSFRYGITCSVRLQKMENAEVRSHQKVGVMLEYQENGQAVSKLILIIMEIKELESTQGH